MPKVFISYSHQQGDWVWSRLVPVLKAAEAELLVDKERFVAGRNVYTQMDATQDQADYHLLCFSAAYLQSTPCEHEWRRALATDPNCTTGRVIPLLVEPGTSTPLSRGISSAMCSMDAPQKRQLQHFPNRSGQPAPRFVK